MIVVVFQLLDFVILLIPTPLSSSLSANLASPVTESTIKIES
uniref:Uncharacterized protein n=1 Tax=Myoviridae sp. ctBtT5 TaxID=2825048 RepID=A0A8S5PZK9_9CAUD|nr:MAG TPA: hypothetical protein [Myoviridae sp. ctBtT5]